MNNISFLGVDIKKPIMCLPPTLHKLYFEDCTFDGNYILRYNASIDGKPDDLLLQYFDPKTQEKSDKKELRKNGAFSFHS